MKWVAIFFACAVVVAKLFFIDFFVVSGVSMEGALNDKSFVAVNKIAYGLVNPVTQKLIFSWRNPSPGDVIFFNLDGKTIVKRCVATAGTNLFYTNESLSGGGFWLCFNDKKIPLNESQYQRLKSSAQVPSGMVLAVGDNYDKSFDSRNYGFVSLDCILGRAFFNE